MAVPSLDDERLDLLVGIYLTAAERIAAQLSRMVDAAGSIRFRIYQQILGVLDELEKQTNDWSAAQIRSFMAEADQAATTALIAGGAVASFGAINEGAVLAMTEATKGFLTQARGSVERLATRIFRGVALEREFPDLANKALREVAVGLAAEERTSAIRREIAHILRPTFRDNVVSVIGQGGRRFSFPLDYYAGMVAHNSKMQARSVATLLRAQEATHDLVRVSGALSKGGDWCNAYRGRVFSISGAHPLYPPLAGTPNGGPPFHPWCAHSLSIFIPSFWSEADQREFANVDQEFLMAANEETPNRVIKNWWASDRETWRG